MFVMKRPKRPRSEKNEKKPRNESGSVEKNPPSRRRGRPMLAASSLKPTRAEEKRQQKLKYDEHISQPGRSRTTRSKTASAARLSSLERLPVEIIHKIFFWCLEPNLARASLTLSKALSHESIYRAVILFAYFDYYHLTGRRRRQRLPVETGLFRSAAGATFRELDYVERCRLQMRILHTRWCTVDRIKAAMPALSRLVMVQRWHEEQLREQSELAALGQQQQAVLPPDDVLAPIAALPSSPSDADAMRKHFLVTTDAYSEVASGHDMLTAADEACGQDNCLPFIAYWGYIRLDDCLVKQPSAGTAVLGVRYIPSWLLRGPWSSSSDPDQQERLAFLKLLRQGLRYVHADRVLNISIDALYAGIKSAIVHYNSRLPISANPLVVLLELWCTTLGVTEAEGEAKLPLYLFHLAAHRQQKQTDYDNDDSDDDDVAAAVMELLIRASLRSIPPDDSVLTAWALRVKANGNGSPLSDWLLTYMTHMDAWNRAVFANGKWVYTSHPSHVFPNVSFTRQIGYMDGLETDGQRVVINPVETAMHENLPGT